MALVLRGLHFQKPPFNQAKLVRCIEGKVLDVAVDLRKESPTYGKHVSVELSDENKRQFFVPRGFAHGFVVLSKSTIFSYKVDNWYAPDHDSGIAWNDPELGIDWKIEHDSILLSEKDKELKPLSQTEIPFGEERAMLRKRAKGVKQRYDEFNNQTNITMELIRTHKELKVYQTACQAGLQIYELTKSFPKEEKYSLTDQIRRSSRSVCANIAEAFRKRGYPKSFVAKLFDSEAEAAEVQVW